MSTVASTRQTASSLLDRTFELLEQVDFRRADSEEDREDIFRLRYEAYLGEGAIAPNIERRFTDPLDDTGNAWLFGVYIDSRLVSSIRIHVVTREFPDSLSVMAFPDFLEPELDAGKIIIDPTRHCVDRDAAAHHPHLVNMTMRLAWMAAAYFEADLLLAAVRVEHQAWYRRVSGHHVVCGPRPYLSLTKPLSLMALDFHEGRARAEQRYPFFRSTNFERRMLFERLQGTKKADFLRPGIIPEVPAELQKLVV